MSRPKKEWISAVELAAREGVSKTTIERAARRKLITSRKKGLGITSEREYPAELAQAQLARLRQTNGIVVPSMMDDPPAAFAIVQSLRDLTARLEILEARIAEALAR